MNQKQKLLSHSAPLRQILIASGLFFLVPDEHFAILIFLVKHGTKPELFWVSMLKKSMKACLNAIHADEIRWHMADRTLTVTGTKDSVLLEFARVESGLPSEFILLTDACLENFRDALRTLSE